MKFVITAGGENDPYLLEDKHSPFFASWIIAVDSFFKNSAQKEVRWCEVWKLCGCRPQPTVQSWKKSCKKGGAFTIWTVAPSC
jgi:hypothetical protein